MELDTTEQKQDFLNFLESKLDDNNKKIFAQHFAIHMANKKEKYPIATDIAMKWFEYTRKDHFTSFFQKHLNKNTDYQFHRSRELTISNKKINEEFSFTVEAINTLSMKANTKKADQIRSYYLELEKLIFEYIITKVNKEKQLLKLTLKTEREMINRKLNRKVDKEKPGQCVYIYGDPDIDEDEISNFKIGRSNNISERERGYICSNDKFCILYTKRCCNSRLLENVIHHTLDQYRPHPLREWFHVKLSIAKQIVNSSQLFLDGLVDNCNELDSVDLFNTLNVIINKTGTANIIARKKSKIKCNEPISTDNIDKKVLKEQLETEVNSSNNPLDFDKFIKDCCIEDTNSHVYSAEIQGAHRIWSRCCNKETRENLLKYLRQKFMYKKITHEETCSKLAGFKGIKLIPLKFELPQNPTTFDNFFNDCYKINFVGRESFKKCM